MAEAFIADLSACSEILTKLSCVDNKRKHNSLARSKKRDKLLCLERSISKKRSRHHKLRVVTPQRIQRLCTKPQDDSLDREIQSIVEIKRRLTQAPTLNEDQPDLYEEERLAIMKARQGPNVTTPYNRRLATSTPHTSPKRMAGTATILSSQSGPTAVGEHRLAFGQQVCQSIQEVYMESLKISLPGGVKTGEEPAQYSLYSENEEPEKPSRDMNKQQAKELRPPISPFKFSNTRKSADCYDANVNAVKTFDGQNSTSQPNTTQKSGNTAQPTNPFADIAHLSRAQLLQAALKVALESGALDGLPAYMQTGPIAPFKLDTAATTTYNSQRHEPPERDHNRAPTEAKSREAPAGSKSTAVRKSIHVYEPPRLTDSVAELHIPDAPSKAKAPPKKAIKASRIETLALPKKMKNRKVQITPGVKKKTDTNGKAKKVVRSAVRGRTEQLSSSTGVQTNTSTSSIQKSQKTTSKLPESKRSINREENKGHTTSDQKIQSSNRSKNEKDEQEYEEMEEDDKENREEEEEEEAGEENEKQDMEKHERGAPLTELSDNIRSDCEVPQLDHTQLTGYLADLRQMGKALKCLPSLKQDKDGKRLLKELEETIEQGHSQLETDFDIAVQPLRNENAQLRRRIRILNQHLRDKDIELVNATKPDPDYMLVQLQMHNYNLESELQSTKQLVSNLKEQVAAYQRSVATKGPQNDKVSSESSRRRQGGEASVPEKPTSLEQQRHEKLEQELKLQQLANQQKQQELDNMQKLVQTLQGSMKKLLTDMQQHQGPRDSFMTSYTGVTEPRPTAARRGEESGIVSESMPCTTGKVLEPAHRPIFAVPTARPGERIELYLMDQPGFNYSKVTDSADKRRSLSTNPDTEITEYRPYPGMSPMHESAFDKLDPFVKELVRSQRLRNLEVQMPTVGEGSATITQTQAIAAGALTITLTESETKESTSTGPTVKELLTPLADRIQRIHTLSDTEQSRAVRCINFDDPQSVRLQGPKPNVMPHSPPAGSRITLARPSIEVSDDSYTVELTKDLEKLHYEDSSSTLLTETSQEPPPAPEQNMTTGIDGDSRYSVTDYFQKYPDAASKSLNMRMSRKPLSQCNEETSDMDDVGSGKATQQREQRTKERTDDSEKHERIGRWAEQVERSAPIDPTEQTDVHISPQVKLYKGTDLDTSLSTIDDGGSEATGLTSQSVTTTGSLSSVDDRIFRQGLANLDANIERVQRSLRQAMLN